MSTKRNISDEGADGTRTKHKGESQQSHQKGAQSVSHRGAGQHRKDESNHDSNDHMDTKKGANSI